MAIDLTPEQKLAGEKNFDKAKEALGLDRRGFLKAGILGAGAVAGSAAAVYFGYQSVQGRPVRAALIGGGDEGGVLVGEHNPDFLKFVAVCDIRPSNMERVLEGEPGAGLRKGFRRVYGDGIDREGGPDHIKQFLDYDAFLAHLKADKSIEAVVIATPLHLHAKMAIDCMRAGKHVLCEKLMAWNVQQCKAMVRVAEETGRVLSIGHQRHYSMLYSHALEVVKSGILGDVKHIRALWHRNFSWPYRHDDKKGKQVPGITPPALRDGWFQPVLQGDFDALKDKVTKYGYDNVEQLIRWRLHEQTGGGLMAELGSHQLDACSIFLGKARPLAVYGSGFKSFFGPGKNDRKIDDHVFCTYEFPGKNHPKGPNKGTDPNDVVVVTYSSISTNGFEAYGECLMGTRGTMVVEAEQKVMLYTEKEPGKKGDQRMLEVKVEGLKPGAAAADASSTWGGPSATVSAASATGSAQAGPISRGYREEMEDFAYCVRLWDEKAAKASREGYYAQRLPRCHGLVAMADAVLALTANRAMRERRRIEFLPEWFDASPGRDEVPDDPKSPPKPGTEVKA
ncbi:MAG: Gfo/Idh/MocA family oxidoreductase [Gemmataceae bacterium]|nr:Gfo/Idh/MocA family oxidoreductase [Gemmataceae bacterium]